MHAKQHISATRSQERLIGGKKPTITVTHQQPFSQTMPIQIQPNLLNSQNLLSAQQEIVVQTKRNAMKTQATQTELYLARKQFSSHHLSLSPRTIHRVSVFLVEIQTFFLLESFQITVGQTKNRTQIKHNIVFF
jgi:hypothetical protein